MAFNEHTCKNCEVNYNNSFAFCPYCGQKRNDKLTLKVLFYNTISNYFSFDARFFKSFLPLMLKPGFLAKKFIEGKRLLYLHPAQMYLFISIVFFFLLSFVQQDQALRLDKKLKTALKKEKSIDSLLHINQKDSIKIVPVLNKVINDSMSAKELKQTFKNHQIIANLSEKEIDSIIKNTKFKKQEFNSLAYLENKLDSLIATNTPNAVIFKEMGMKQDDGYFTKRAYSQLLKFYKSKKGSGMLNSFYNTVPIAMFFLLPIFAFVLKLLYYKRGLYAYHLVFSFYYFSFLFTSFSIILGINLIWDIPDWIDLLIVLSTGIYLLLSIKRFYNQNWLKSILKCSITVFVFLLFVTPLTFAFLLMYAFMFY